MGNLIAFILSFKNHMIDSNDCGKIFPVQSADVAQLAEHITRNNEVMGSIPIIGSVIKNSLLQGVFCFSYCVQLGEFFASFLCE